MTRKSIILPLLPPSNLSDLESADGEMVSACWIFSQEEIDGRVPRNADSTPGSGGSDTASSVVRLEPMPEEEAAFSVPTGMCPLAIVHPDGAPAPHLILRDASGRLAMMRRGSQTVSMLSPASTPHITEAVLSGRYLTALSDSGLLFAAYDSKTDSYDWMGAVPEPPGATVRAEPAALPPYSASAADLPVINVAVAVADGQAGACLDWLSGTNTSQCPEGVKKAVRTAVEEAFSLFLKRVEGAGLDFFPMKCAVAYLTTAATLLRPSTPMVLAPESPVTLRISSAGHSGGTLMLALTVSRPPFRATIAPTTTLSAPWRACLPRLAFLRCEPCPDITLPAAIGDVAGTGGSTRGFIPAAVSAESRQAALEARREYYTTATAATASYPSAVSLPVPSYGAVAEELPDTSDMEIPAHIRSFSGVLFSIGERLTTSLPGLPMAGTGSCAVGGGKLMDVVPSLKSLSSGQPGEFPLYAFTTEGIHALSPASGGGFRDVQLISRDVPLSPGSIAVMSDATAFLTARGVMSVSGTTVKELADSLADDTGDRTFTDSDRLVCHYASRTLILYNPDAGDCRLLDIRSGKWHRSSMRPDRYMECWPMLAIAAGNAIHFLRSVRADDIESGNGTGGESWRPDVPSTDPDIPAISGDCFIAVTRPLKFGNAFVEKKIRKISIMWPDGRKRKFTLEGAVTPGKWRKLGVSEGETMKLRGSGWRLFRLVFRYPLPEGEKKVKFLSNIKPLIYCELEN